MIVVKLMGGLGNQMFQYAFGRSLSLKMSLPLTVDLSWFNNTISEETKRFFELEPFGIAIPVSTNSGKIKFPGITSRIFRKFTGQSVPIILREGFDISKKKILNSKYIILDGYFQREEYFAEHASIVRADFLRKCTFGPALNSYQDIVNNPFSVSVHVRRGDYINNPNANIYHGVLPLDYYIKAIGQMKEMITTPEFIFFSDDINWCRDNFYSYPNVSFVETDSERSPVSDLWLMSRCSNHIIGNSSFSWWGAWLSENLKKKIIAPKTWFSHIQSKPFILPEKWIRL